MGSKVPDKSNIICGVCNAYIMPSHEILVLWQCRHIFHILCIEAYHEMVKDCPTCLKESRRY
ncbi:Vacuolar protein sorting-associated protein 11 like protein [Lucilia cuprina]|nr:Vacuolar protein sorting-associated protein 11 like protein [Lucilia cuprina]